MTSQSHTAPSTTTETISLSFAQILRMAMKYWYIFVLSVLLFGSLAVLFVRQRPLGSTAYFMHVSSREAHEVMSPHSYPQAVDGAIVAAPRTSPWAPEYIASIFYTTSVLEQAGVEVDFQTNYAVETAWGRRDYYNQTPILVRFLDLPADGEASCVAELDDPEHPTKVSLRQLTGRIGSRYITEPSDAVVEPGGVVETPLGRIAVVADDPEQHYPHHIPQQYTKIEIHRSTLDNTRILYDRELAVKSGSPIKDAPSSVIRVEIESDQSERRCLELLRKMYLVADSIAWVKQIADLRADTPATILARRGAAVADSTHVADADAVVVVPSIGESPLEMIDEPRLTRSKLPDLFLLIGLPLLGLLLPFFLLYIYWAFRGVVYSTTELSPRWRERLLLDIRRKGRRLHDAGIDELRYLVSRPTDGDTSHRVLLCATPTSTKYHAMLLDTLRDNATKAGISTIVWHLLSEDERAPESKPMAGHLYQTLTAGYIGSAAYAQQLKQLQEQYQLVVIAAPATTQSDALYLLHRQCEGAMLFVYRGATRLCHLKRTLQSIDHRSACPLERWKVVWIH